MMLPRLFTLLTTWVCVALASEDSSLVRLRNLAATLSKRKDLGGPAAYCEFAPISQVYGCSGPKRNEVRHRAHPDGTIESWWYRSPAESGNPIGYYKGKMPAGEWRAILKLVSRMRLEKTEAGGAPLLPPPGPTESIKVLTLSDGKTLATYSTTGVVPVSISDAFDRLGILAQAETDTVWELSLLQPKAEIRKDSVAFTARWNWRGPSGARLILSENAGGEYCGKARFKWYLDTSAFQVDWHRAEAGTAGPKTWELATGLSAPFRLAFVYDGPKGAAKRVGALDGIGVRLIPGSGSDTVSVTLFTDNFGF